MEPLTGFVIAGVLVAAIGFRYFQGLYGHHRLWVGEIDGQLLKIEAKGRDCSLYMNNQQVHSSRLEYTIKAKLLGGGIRPRGCFRFNINENLPVFAGQALTVTSDWYYSNDGAVAVFIGGKQIPLIEVEDKTPEAVKKVESSLRKQNVVISDERWPHICKLLPIVRDVLGEKEHDTIDKLQTHLATRFQLLTELQSDETVAIWSDESERSNLIDALEEELSMGCAAVEKLHEKSVQQRKNDLPENDLEEVWNLVARMEAEQEVDAPEGEKKRKLLQKIAQKRRL